jgi:dihydrofolate reductase
MINLIAAVSQDGFISKGGEIPWTLDRDLEFFRTMTMGHSLIMGRKTWESLPDKSRPLKNRTNIVMTRNEDYIAKGATVVHDILSAMTEAQRTTDNIFVIGGEDIYRMFMPYANKLYITHVHQNVAGDAKFPLELVNPLEWRASAFPMCEENGLYFRFVELERF